MIMNIKQKKIQIEPKVKLNYNIFIFCWLRKQRQRRALERPAEETANTAQDNQHYQKLLNQEDHQVDHLSMKSIKHYLLQQTTLKKT